MLRLETKPSLPNALMAAAAAELPGPRGGPESSPPAQNEWNRMDVSRVTAKPSPPPSPPRAAAAGPTPPSVHSHPAPSAVWYRTLLVIFVPLEEMTYSRGEKRNPKSDPALMCGAYRTRHTPSDSGSTAARGGGGPEAVSASTARSVSASAAYKSGVARSTAQAARSSGDRGGAEAEGANGGEGDVAWRGRTRPDRDVVTGRGHRSSMCTNDERRTPAALAVQQRLLAS